MGQAKNRAAEINALKAASMGYKPVNASMIAELVAGMKAQLADPNSPVNQYTKMCRAKGIPCLQDQLDAGKTLEQAARESVFTK